MTTLADKLAEGGIINVLPTPFTSEREVDYTSLKHLVKFQLDKGVQGLLVLAVLGENYKLSVEERNKVMSSVITTAEGKVPIVVGTAHDDLNTCIKLSKEAFTAGATAVMVAPPPGCTSDDAILNLYEKLSVGIEGKPIVVQDCPLICDIKMSVDLLAKLVEKVPNARYIKMEDRPLPQKVTAIREKCGDKLAIFAGLGGVFFLEELQRGSVGVMTGFAFTEVMLKTYKAFKEGKQEEAERVFDKYMPLIRYENQPSVGLPIRKEILRLRGAISTAVCRDPYVPMDELTRTKDIPNILRRVGIEDPQKPAPLC